MMPVVNPGFFMFKLVLPFSCSKRSQVQSHKEAGVLDLIDMLAAIFGVVSGLMRIVARVEIIA